MSDQQGGPPDDPYADLVKPAGRRAPADPYADLTASPASSGDVDLSKPGTPNERRAGKVPGAPVLTPPPMAPRDASRVALNARQTYRPGAIERGLDQAGQFIGEAIHDPVGTAAGLVTAPVRSAVHAVLSPTIGDPRANPNHSKGGNSAGLTASQLAQPYDAEHGGITERERAAAGLQTVANVAFPGIESVVAERATTAGASRLGGKLLGLAAAGAPAGAAYSPDDPMAGAIAGGLLAPVLGLAHEGATQATRATFDAARSAAGHVAPAVDAVRSAARRIGNVIRAPEDAYSDLTASKDVTDHPNVSQRGAEGQGRAFGRGDAPDAPPALDDVHAALTRLRDQYANATDPMERGELESRLNMLELQRRKLTGEPMPETAMAGQTRAAAAAGVRSIDTVAPAVAERPVNVPENTGGNTGGAPRPAFRDLLDMSPEEIQGHADEAISADRRIEPELFGEEGAKRYQRLQRVANSTTRSHEETAAAGDEIARMESTLSDAQRDRLYGIGDQGLSADDLKAAASSATFYHPDNAQHLNAANLLSTVGRELTTGRPESDIASALNLKGAATELQRRTGKPIEQIIGEALTERGRRGELASPEQAGELLRARMAALHKAGLFADAGPVEVAPAVPRLAVPTEPGSPYSDLTGGEAEPPALGEPTSPARGSTTRGGVVLDALREERGGLTSDYDPPHAERDQVRNEAGDMLFSQTPGAFAREIAASRAAEGKPPLSRATVAVAGPRVEQGAAVVHPSPLQQRMAVVRSAIRIDAFKDAVLKVFGPASRSEDAATIALAIRDAGGSFARRNEMAREALKEFAGTFDRMPKADRLDFIDRVEGGRPQENPALQKAADIMRHLLDSARDEIRGLGTGKLSHWIENYFPHLWENADDAVTFIDHVMSKRSMSGPGTFLKQRSIPTLREGIEAGLEPLTTNPIDMTLLKLREMHKYLAGQQILAELKQSGMAKFVSALERGPSGLVKLDDKLGTIYGPPHVQVTEGFDKVVRGKLEAIMQELGVTHTRRANIGGRGRMGYAEGGRAVTTKAGGPDTVIEHELGHILDAKLGVWDRLTKIPGQDRPSIEARKQLHQELRDLADMRMEGEDTGDLPKSYKQYLRKKEEKIANAVHALVYMPERMQEVAPMVKARLTDILRSHPIAGQLLDVKPSLTLGTADYTVPVGGLVVKGHWYVPEPVGRVINNHLSPGLAGNPFYDLYRGVGNSMNQWQLGFSAFHLGFTSMDAAVSKTALGVEQLAAGRPLDAARSLANVPLAPITNYLRGSRVLREYLAPGTGGGEMAATVDALVRGGGRVRMDEFYGGGAFKQFREALNAGKIGRAARLSLPALLEGSGKLVMEHIVPRQKLGVFADLAQFELSKLPPDATKEQVRAVMAQAWDSVDNRMGQLVYDNLFWHRAAKDLTMASVRSVGWNVGTVRELGGGIGDAVGLPRALAHRAAVRAGLPGDWQGANDAAQLSHRTAYVMALPMTVGLAGAVITYLYTGEAPRELKDYFYPRTGRKNPDGTEERIQLPSYMRDVGDYGRHPVQTLVNKLHPLAGTLRDMLANQDFYGHEIHNPDDPMVQQAMQQAKYVASQFEPFGVRNATTQIQQGQGHSAALNFIGITPAPREETRTAADLRMSQEMGRRARGNLTPEEVEKQGQRRSLLGALWMHNPKASDLANEAMRSGAIAPKDLDHVLRDASMPPDVQRFSRLPLAEAQRVFKLATPEEQRRFAPVLFEKLDAAKQRGSLLGAMGLK